MTFPSDDRYFRFSFADTVRVANLLREYLPAELVQCLDLDRLRRIHENQIRDNLQESRDDLNLECPAIPGGIVQIRILVEHKSAHAPELWLQLMRTICVDWELGSFRPIIPVIVHTGPERFQLDSPRHCLKNFPRPIQNSLPMLRVFPIDLSQHSETAIWASNNLDHVSKVALSILRLSQQKNLDIANLRTMLRQEWQGISRVRQSRYICSRPPRRSE